MGILTLPTYSFKQTLNKHEYAVKINDLTDNMDIRRLSSLSNKDFKRLEKYHKAYKQLLKLI